MKPWNPFCSTTPTSLPILTPVSRRYLIITGMILLVGILQSQDQRIAPYKSASVIEESEEPSIWMDLSAALDSAQVKPKKIFIELYTDWCGVCKMFDRKTLRKPRITELLQKDFYPVRFNAEQTRPVQFGDSLFQFDPTLGRGIHSLAYHLGKEAESLSYPTIVILDTDLNIIYKYASFMSVANLEEVLYLYR